MIFKKHFALFALFFFVILPFWKFLLALLMSYKYREQYDYECTLVQNCKHFLSVWSKELVETIIINTFHALLCPGHKKSVSHPYSVQFFCWADCSVMGILLARWMLAIDFMKNNSSHHSQNAHNTQTLVSEVALCYSYKEGS